MILDKVHLGCGEHWLLAGAAASIPGLVVRPS
jgi:hypothetical protein